MRSVRSNEFQLMACSSDHAWTTLSSVETLLAHIWYEADSTQSSEIADLLHLDKSTIARLLVCVRARLLLIIVADAAGDRRVHVCTRLDLHPSERL